MFKYTTKLVLLVITQLFLLTVLPINSVAQCADSCGCDTDKYKYAFETTLSGGGLGVSSIAYEKILNERVGLLFNFDFGISDFESNEETTLFESDTLEILRKDSEQRASKSYGFSVTYLYRFANKRNIDLVLGFGPSINYSNKSRDLKKDQDTGSYYYRDYSYKTFYYGARVVLYAEWHFRDNVSFFAKTGLSYYYYSFEDGAQYRTDDPPSYYYPSLDRKNNIHSFTKNNGSIGIKMYF
jgi:hypothetical protein